MTCPRCHAETPLGMRFCGQCGARLAVLCRSCGATNPPEHKFCGQCASPLVDEGAAGAAADISRAQVGRSGEFRQVTILFCDIVNSTGLTLRIGAEALHALLNRFLDAGVAEVQRYGGTVPQFLGDGFMAIFGAPVAYEDHVRRALMAALAIRRVAADSGASGDLALRIGIDTGLVVFGAIADSMRMDPTAIGDTAILAARLEQAAEPGAILVGAATRDIARDFAELEPVGPLALKGKAEPVVAYRLIELAPHRSAPGRVMGFAGPFLGREVELAGLGNLLRHAETGRGQIVGITGEPGIGKSRLLAEFHQAAGRGISWVSGRCVSYGSAIPYQLLLDLVRSSFRITEADAPAAIAGKLGSGLRAVGLDSGAEAPLLLDLLGLEGTDAGAPKLAPEALKAKVFDIFRQLSIKGSQRRPLVLAVEDLQWLDATSAEFLAVLSEDLPGARILVLATYRPGYRPPWIGKSYAAQIPLPALSRDESLALVRPILDQRRLDQDLAEAIVGRAEGNPLFLEQLALHAGEADDPRSTEAVPATIRDVVMARIDRLPQQTRRLLQLAAVAGREFSQRLLRELWPGPEPVEPGLRELTRLEFLYERLQAGETSYAFRHALTQDAAYAGLLERDRRACHARVGRALESIYRDRTDEVAELLALHFGRSDDREKAIDATILAAEKAQRRWANSDALGYFDDALRRLDQAPDTKPNRLRRIDAVVKETELKLALGRHAEHVDALDAIRGLVEETGDPRHRVAWHYWTGFLQVLTGGAAAGAIAHCREAAAIAAAAGFHDLDGFIASCLAQASIVAGELRPAIEEGERALAIFEAEGNLWWASRALWHLSSAANYLGEFDASLGYCRRALDHGATLNDLRLKTTGLWRMGLAYIQQGNFERGLPCCDEALALKPIPYDAATTRMTRGYGLVKAGQIDAGIAELNDVVAWFASFRLSHIRLIATLWLAEGYLARGDHASARPFLDEVIAETHDRGYLHLEGLAHRLMGICVAAEAPPIAERHVESALRILDRIGARNDFAKALITHAKLRHAGGDRASARQLLGQAAEIFRTLGTRDEPVRVEAALAQLDRCSNNIVVREKQTCPSLPL